MLQQKQLLFSSLFFTYRKLAEKAFREELMLSKVKSVDRKRFCYVRLALKCLGGNASPLTSNCCLLTNAWQAIIKQLLGKGQCWDAEYQSDSTSRPTSSATSRRAASSTASPRSNHAWVRAGWHQGSKPWQEKHRYAHFWGVLALTVQAWAGALAVLT